MLGLRQQIGGAEHRVRRLVGHDDGLARTVQRIDADVAEDLAFRQRDEDVARPAHLIDLRDARRPIRECGDSLRAAHAKDTVHAGQIRRDELERRDAALRIGRRGDQHLLNAGYLGRQHRHQHG